MRWSVKDVALGAALLGVLVSLWALRGGRAAQTEPGDTAPKAPPGLAAGTERIRSQVRADGSILVTHWLRTSAPVDQVRVQAPAAAGGGAVTVRGLEVGGAGSSVRSPGRVQDEQVVDLESPSDVVYVHYLLDGVVARSGSAPGRSLAAATFADVVVDGGSRARLVSVTGGTVRALACADAGAAAEPQPCGRPSGSGWAVRLSGEPSTVQVSAQVDLP